MLKFSFIIYFTNNTGWASGIPGFDFLKIINDNAQSSVPKNISRIVKHKAIMKASIFWDRRT